MKAAKIVILLSMVEFHVTCHVVLKAAVQESGEVVPYQ